LYNIYIVIPSYALNASHTSDLVMTAVGFQKLFDLLIHGALVHITVHTYIIAVVVVATLKNKNNNICRTCGPRGVIIILLHTYPRSKQAWSCARVCAFSAKFVSQQRFALGRTWSKKWIKISISSDGNTNTKNYIPRISPFSIIRISILRMDEIQNVQISSKYLANTHKPQENYLLYRYYYQYILCFMYKYIIHVRLKLFNTYKLYNSLWCKREGW